MPEREVRGPDRERDEGVREHAQAADRADGEERAQQRPVQPREREERREVDQEHVLEHVEGEVLLAERVHRRGDRDEQRPEPRGERRQPPARDGMATAAQRRRASGIGGGEHPDRSEL